jgi:hypothetical protein
VGGAGGGQAGQDPRPNWIVGSNAGLPVLPGTLDRVLCMFGFPVYAEFARVLKAAASCCRSTPARITCANCAKSSTRP